MTEAADETTLAALRRLAARTATARRLDGDVETALLASVVDAAVVLFEAEAASIALYEPGSGQLEFRVAAGAQGGGVIGLSIAPTQGIAGFVFSTGQPIALTDVASDPRFDQATAERSGYVPRSIAAVPLMNAGAATGVLQVLDKHSAEAFSLRDMELLGVFARQAAAAIDAARVGRDSERLLRAVLARVGDQELSDAQLDALVGTLSDELDGEAETPYWALVDAVARMRDASDDDAELAREILAVVTRHRAPGRPRG